MGKETTGKLLDRIEGAAGKLGDVKLMEVCGTHTVSLFRSGIKSMLPKNITLLSGPGCPVCITSQGYIDAAIELAQMPDVVICTYGDMVRVPGRTGSLERQRAQGAGVRIVYSARDALEHAEQNPEKKIVWLAVGFETTAPATAAVVLDAYKKSIPNFFALMGHKLVVPAMMALLAEGDVPVDGFLCPGHVSVIIGSQAYEPVARVHGKPCTVAGFEPEQMLSGILDLLDQIACGVSEVHNVYGAAVTGAGNSHALRFLQETFVEADSIWRAIGVIPASGLELKDIYSRYDALEHFGIEIGPDYDPPGCRCGEVIQGKVLPRECSLFGSPCTPADPIGPCMVSSEGTCAAWYKYGGAVNNDRAGVPAD